MHVANALANCEPPQTVLVKQPPGGRGSYGAGDGREKEEEGSGGWRVDGRGVAWLGLAADGGRWGCLQEGGRLSHGGW